MTASLNNFMQALSANEAALRELAAFLDEEQQSIVNLDSAAIEGRVERKNLLLARLEGCAADCRLRLRQLGRELQLPQAETISALLPRLTGVQQAALRKLQQSLQELSDEVNRLLAFNRELLDSSLGIINSSLQFFNSLLTKRPTYGQHGMMMDSGSSIRLVNKEI
jgi:flagellar biosynthesis/type III secretory pathway chaperone